MPLKCGRYLKPDDRTAPQQKSLVKVAYGPCPHCVYSIQVSHLSDLVFVCQRAFLNAYL